MKALCEEKQVDFEASGLKYLTNDARVSQPCNHVRSRPERNMLLKVTGPLERQRSGCQLRA